MVSSAERMSPRRGLTRLGRIEGQAKLPYVEPPSHRRSSGRLLRWTLGGAVLLAVAGTVWFLSSRVTAVGMVEGEMLTVQAPAPVSVEKVWVSPGEWCKKGAPLVRLTPREPDPARGVLEAQLHAARLRLELVERGGEAQDLLLTRRFDERDRLAAEAEAARAALDAAQARYDFAQRELARLTELHQRGNYSTREVNEAERDAQVAEAEVNQAKSDLEGASQRWRRQRTLMPAGAEGDDLRALELAMLRENVREAEERLREFDHRAGSRVITAPFSGRVDRVFVEAGSAREQDEPLLSLYDPESLYVLAYVAPEDVEDFPVGRKVRLYAEGATKPIPGAVEVVHTTWTPVPAILQRAYGNQQPAITVRIGCGSSDRQRLAPNMLMRVIVAER